MTEDIARPRFHAGDVLASWGNRPLSATEADALNAAGWHPEIGPTGAGYMADTSRRLPPPSPSQVDRLEQQAARDDALHMMSHDVHQIAADVHEMLALFRKLADE